MSNVTTDVKHDSSTYKSVRDIPPIELDLAGKPATFRCPKMAIWQRTQVMIYARSSGDLSKLTKRELGSMQDRIDEFFIASMGREGYDSFNARFLDADDDLDAPDLLYALVYLTEKWLPIVNDLASQAKADVAALWDARPGKSK